MTPRNARLHLLGTTLAAGALSLTGSMASADIVHADDVIIQGSLCVGVDCTNGLNFGFDTLILKENNLRLFFDDTSSSGSFPKNDWRFIANDSSNGGLSYLGIEDATAGRIPFRIVAGAPANALYVDAQGDVGLGTSNPVIELHVVDGDSPTLRLEQDGSSGFTAQTFDLVSNEANFFIRDVTNGSQLPFRIKPGADTDALFIAANNEIGLGTDAPGADLHVRGGGTAFSADAITLGLFQSNAAVGDAARLTILSGNTGNSQLAFGDADNEIAGRIRYNHSTDTMDFFTGGSTRAITLDGGGANVISTATSTAVLTAAGVWQNASSRALKQNIENLSLDAAMSALQGLQPVTYNYKVEPDELTVGFIAEDVPDLVATASHKTLSSLDIVAVLTKVVQDQNAAIGALKEQSEQQSARIQQLERQISVQ